MAGPTVDQATQIQTGAPGTAMLGSNTRVRGQPGFLGTQVDTLTFGDGFVGQWIVVNTRVRVNGVFTVSQSSTGTAARPSPPPTASPVLVSAADGRIRTL